VLSAVLFVALMAPAAGWESLRFLQGDWIGEGGGQPGQSSAASFSFHPELDGKILVRKSRSEYPATKDRPAVVHQDLMVIHGGGADYYDNEGHTIRYAVKADGKSAVFSSKEDAGPSFRLTYVSTGADTISIKFEIAPPGKAFQTYVEGKARRK
jgi:hypothetical protein